MSKSNQKIVLFIEPAFVPWSKPTEIGNLFINRFAIDEDASHEIVKIYQFQGPTVGLDLVKYEIIVYDS